ncbi:anthranilate phosphoribosyltransferase, partial [Akkermansiaceae bacterium]|nr:anthranilate phosphoribosyltransferase [Akkermansiaceae bacterium]
MEKLIDHLNQGEELTPREIAVAADFLLDESGDVAKKAHFLKAMAEKGESAAEIAGFVSVFLEKAERPSFYDHSFNGPTIDVCGT